VAVALVGVAVLAAAVVAGVRILGNGGAGGKPTAAEVAFDISRVAPPVAAPPFRAETADGKPFTLADLKGQVVFLNFWATWCPPCREEMPSMLQLGRELADRHPGKFRMVAVSVDDGWPEVARFFGGRLPQGLTVVRDGDQSATRSYYCAARGACPDSYKFPETYILDASGRLVGFVVGPRDWSEPGPRQFLQRLLD
jgi:thiol-disulfide isomerase/thioredoxin